MENLKALAALYGVTMDQLTGMVTPSASAFSFTTAADDVQAAMGGLGRLFGDESSAAPCGESTDDREKRETSFYRGIFWLRTVIVLLKSLLLGRLEIPFDWIFMLVGLWVRKSWVYWTTMVFVGINLATAILLMAQGEIAAFFLLMVHGAILYLYTRGEIRDYFHLPEKKEGDQ